MLSVYNLMLAGLAVSGVVAWTVGSNAALFEAVSHGPLKWVVMLAPLGIVFAMSFGAASLSASALRALYFVFSALLGVSLSYIGHRYAGADIARALFITTGAFAGLSLFGYTTKRDLSGFGVFLVVGLFGLILAMVVNVFMQSSALQFALSVISVLIFGGFTAYDTQNLKTTYSERIGDEGRTKMAVMGALNLYLNFINMFQAILSLTGGSDD
jgi:FtsH-binding integral membrane protein